MTAAEGLAAFEAELAGRLDELDLPGAWTQREKNTYLARTAALAASAATVRGILVAVDDAEHAVAAVEHQIADLEAWQLFLTTTRKTLCDDLLALSTRGRSREVMEQQQQIEYCIDTVDRGPRALPGAIAFTLRSTRVGELMIAAGYLPDPNDERLRQFSGLPWRGGLKEVERELKALTAQLDRATSARAVARRQVEQVEASWKTETVASSS